MTGQLELVVDAKAALGEGPSWDSEKNILYWVDILEKKIHSFNPVTNENQFIQLEQYVGAIVPTNTHEAIVALENGFNLLNFETKELTFINDPEKHLPSNRFNDGKCDAYGRFWAGTMDKTIQKGQGSLYCLDTDLHVKKKVSKLGISNGLAWSLDNKFFYHIDTLEKTVVSYDFDLMTGDIKNPTIIIQFPEGEGMPDGMTIDAEGMLWIAHWGGAKVSRWNPSTGILISTIEVPARNVTSCTFGGQHLDELYITTARTDLDDSQLKKFPDSGGVFRVKTAVKGTPTYRFKGIPKR